MISESKNILIIGATSGIGRALCTQYINRGCKVAISGRRANLLAEVKGKNPNIFTYVDDITNFNAAALTKQAAADMGGLDTIIISAGIGYINFELSAKLEMDTALTNASGFTAAAVAAYKYFEDYSKTSACHCRLGAISSIASFRGADSAPAYYASKAYVSNYMEGLCKKAYKAKADISLTTIIPGFVDTALGQGVGGKGLFWVAPATKAAVQIVKAMDNNKRIVYITKRWWLIAWVLKLVPFWIYKRAL